MGPVLVSISRAIYTYIHVDLHRVPMYQRSYLMHPRFHMPVPRRHVSCDAASVPNKDNNNNNNDDNNNGNNNVILYIVVYYIISYNHCMLNCIYSI